MSPADPDCVVVQAFPSELGWMAATWKEGRLQKFVFGHGRQSEALRALRQPVAANADDDPRYAEFAARMQAFAAGQIDNLRDIPLESDGLTPFQHRVREQCRRIGTGQTVSYGELARRAGRPGAARAVGTVMSSNPFPLIVPCHRVVGASGRLGGYSAPDGLRTKRKLLAREGVTLRPSRKTR